MTEHFKPPMVGGRSTPKVATGCSKIGPARPACPAKTISPDGSRSSFGDGNGSDKSKPDFQETSEHYYRVVARKPNFRVILCKDAIQWIIQRRARGAQRRVGARWKSFSHHTDRQSLIRVWQAKTAPPVPDEITRLPETVTRLPEYGHRRR